MSPYIVYCSKCKKKTELVLNKPISLICQSCGNSSGIVETVGEPKNLLFAFKCGKCSHPFTIVSGNDFYLGCPNPRCNSFAISLEDVTPLSRFIEVTNEEYPYPVIDPFIPSLDKDFFVPPPASFIKTRIAIPYYQGEKRVDRAVLTWIRPEVVFIITDKNTIPPGWGVCNQIFTSKNARSEEVESRTKPFIFDIMKKLMDDFPNDEYYGFFNSDIILSPGAQIYDLLPSKGKDIVFHHRRNVSGKDEDSIYDLSEKSQVFAGKDGFIANKKTMNKIIQEMNDMIVGSATWDDGMVLWCRANLGKDNVELRYGEIYHSIHPQEWSCDDPGTKYNRKQLIASGVPEGVRVAINWFNEGNETVLKKRKNKLGIIKPGKVGDIIIILPIAKWYHDMGYEIIWPVLSEYIPLFSYVPYVKAVDIGNSIQNSYTRSWEYFKEQEIDKVIDLGIGFGREEKDWRDSGLSFDEWKYKEAGVPFEERFNLSLVRNFQKEHKLEEKLGLLYKKDYSFTHSIGSKGYAEFDAPNAVEFKMMEGFTIFDWIGVIEKAQHVYCVDSCFAHLVNQLGLAKGRRTFSWLQNFPYKNHYGLRAKVNWEGENNPHLGIKTREAQNSVESNGLPVHFFTIVLNGMPFIKYHSKVLEKLPFEWHWHIIEGLADLKYDTSWSILTGGKINDNLHCLGRSQDGTSEYLDDLEIQYEGRVTIYRKPEGQIWDGKREMVNAPIPNLPKDCLLWEIDVDELWTAQSMINMYNMFRDNPEKMGAFLYAYHFVGPKRYVSSMNTWGTLPGDWLRVFRFSEGFHWSKHEPPTLVDKNNVDRARKKFFSREETFKNGIYFQHFAYVERSQLVFKESYYGYRDAVKRWENLQKENGNDVDLHSFFPWAVRGTVASVWDEKKFGKPLYPGECK